MSLSIQEAGIFGAGETAPHAFEYYVDILQAAAHLQERVAMVRGWAETGWVPAHRLRDGAHSCWKFKLSELEEWQRRIDEFQDGGKAVPHNQYDIPLCREHNSCSYQ